MATKRMVAAFSLIDILVAICIVVIVATIAIPLFASLQTDAQSAVANQIQSELTNTYAKWKDSGGQVNGMATTSDILYLLSQPPSASPRHPSPNGAVSDGGTSSLISVTMPAGTDLSSYASSSAQPSSVIILGGSSGFFVYSLGVTPGSSSNPQFIVVPACNIQWSAPAAFNQYSIPDPGPVNGISVRYNGVTLGTIYGALDLSTDDEPYYYLDPVTSYSGTFLGYNPSTKQYYQVAYTLIGGSPGQQWPYYIDPPVIGGRPGIVWNTTLSIGTLVPQ